MNSSKNLLQYFLSALTLIFVMQGCASMGSSTSSHRVYSQNFDESKSLIREGVERTNLAIEDIYEAEDADRITFYVSRHTSVNDRPRIQERGEVSVTKIDEDQIRVEIENPEYHYTVPNFERKDYRRKLFPVFDEVL